MPNPTLYDNFSQVKQYIDQNQVDLSSYVSKSELNNASYATTTDLKGTILPASNTYNLGSAQYPYANIQSLKFTIGSYFYVTPGNQAELSCTTNGELQTNSSIVPSFNNNKNLGKTNYQFGYTYTQNLILNGTDIKTLINGMFSYDSATGTLTITTL